MKLKIITVEQARECRRREGMEVEVFAIRQIPLIDISGPDFLSEMREKLREVCYIVGFELTEGTLKPLGLLTGNHEELSHQDLLVLDDCIERLNHVRRRCDRILCLMSMVPIRNRVQDKHGNSLIVGNEAQLRVELMNVEEAGTDVYQALFGRLLRQCIREEKPDISEHLLYHVAVENRLERLDARVTLLEKKLPARG